MADFDYKKYSLEQLENWINDSLSAAEASPQEIYDVIKKTVKDYYYTYKNHTSRAYELLALLNGNGQSYKDVIKEREYYEPSPECKGVWNSFWEEHYYPEEHQQYTEEELNAMCDAAEKQDKVVKWQLPVEMHPSGECYVLFPDDLLEASNLEEGDTVEWIDQGDGSYLLKKVK